MRLPLFRVLTHRPSIQALTYFRPPRLPTGVFSEHVSLRPEHQHKYHALVEWHHADLMHPLYLQMLSLPLQLRCLTQYGSPVPVLGLVHTANIVKWQPRALTATEVQLQVRFDSWSAHPRGWEVSLSLVARDNQGEIYRAVPKYLIRVAAPHVAKQHQVVNDKPVGFWQDTNVLAQVSLAEDLGRRYAQLSGDFNPIHLWPLTAKVMGFKQPIIHGMWSLARAASAVITSQPWVLQQARTLWRTTFLKPLYLPGSADVVMTTPTSPQPASIDFALCQTQQHQIHLLSTLTSANDLKDAKSRTQ